MHSVLSHLHVSYFRYHITFDDYLATASPDYLTLDNVSYRAIPNYDPAATF